MRRRYVSIPFAIALFAPIPALAKNVAATAPTLCVNCAAAVAASKNNQANAATTAPIKAAEHEPYKGPRTVPPHIARRAALLAILCGGDPNKAGR